MPARSRIISVALIVCAAAACLFLAVSNGKEKSPTLQAIEEEGVITLITRNNANSYFIYRKEPAGFEYDLAKRFSEHLGVELEVITPSWSQMIPKLRQGKGDFIAAGLTITKERDEKVDFSQGYFPVQQQIVLHRGDRGLREVTDLDGKTVHVRPDTTYANRLRSLNQRDDLQIDIALHPELPTEELIRRVARKKIRITVADSNIAMLNRRFYPSIRIAFPIEEKQSLGWAVREGDDGLLREINNFLNKVETNGFLGKVRDRYYADVHIFDYVDVIKFHQRLETRLPRFKDVIKEYARKHGFDWKLIAAMAYQESHLNPDARSFTGVRGLMQITLRTAREMGITNRLDPEQSVRAGVKYLNHLYKRWDELSERDRIKFAMASYNIGYGHVRDAQKLARQQGYAPKEWSGLKKALPLLRIKEHYQQTRFGYARGTEPVRYVKRIMKYYSILKQREDVASDEKSRAAAPDG